MKVGVFCNTFEGDDPPVRSICKLTSGIRHTVFLGSGHTFHCPFITGSLSKESSHPKVLPYPFEFLFCSLPLGTFHHSKCSNPHKFFSDPSVRATYDTSSGTPSTSRRHHRTLRRRLLSLFLNPKAQGVPPVSETSLDRTKT